MLPLKAGAKLHQFWQTHKFFIIFFKIICKTKVADTLLLFSRIVQMQQQPQTSQGCSCCCFSILTSCLSWQEGYSTAFFIRLFHHELLSVADIDAWFQCLAVHLLALQVVNVVCVCSLCLSCRFACPDEADARRDTV